MTIGGFTCRASGACAAAVKADCDLITDGERLHVGADLHHGSTALMAQDAGQRERQLPVLHSDVGVTDAGSGDLD
ncbi:putative zinc-binding alcohol dehydrogenase domain protein [Mycobacterium kansasii]|uniref:Putative zinc-binding alcohol dehydrogenase domain protein n=1 Tax=Mycobacterium kansasii TaxID=1768 RepID=A0A1V3XYF8_MYCKA|nr:putative zinc-binding alcohol dehydrogenase domain protein [Mycobacterium kansasii]